MFSVLTEYLLKDGEDLVFTCRALKLIINLCQRKPIYTGTHDTRPLSRTYKGTFSNNLWPNSNIKAHIET